MNLLKELLDLAEGDVIQGNFPQKAKFVYLSQQRDAGAERTFWNGVNWFSPQNKALAVAVDKVDAIIKSWRPASLKQHPVG